MKVVSIVALLLLTACSSSNTVDYSNDSIVLKPTEPQPIATKSVEFKVINRTTVSSIDLDSTSWYAVDSRNYENLAYNMQNILRFIKQQRAVIEYYEKTVLDSDTN